MVTLYFQYGRTALELVLKSVLGHVPPLAKPPSDYIGDFYPGSLQMITFAYKVRCLAEW